MAVLKSVWCHLYYHVTQQTWVNDLRARAAGSLTSFGMVSTINSFPASEWLYKNMHVSNTKEQEKQQSCSLVLCFKLTSHSQLHWKEKFFLSSIPTILQSLWQNAHHRWVFQDGEKYYCISCEQALGFLLVCVCTSQLSASVQLSLFTTPAMLAHHILNAYNYQCVQNEIILFLFHLTNFSSQQVWPSHLCNGDNSSACPSSAG